MTTSATHTLLGNRETSNVVGLYLAKSGKTAFEIRKTVFYSQNNPPRVIYSHEGIYGAGSGQDEMFYKTLLAGWLKTKPGLKTVIEFNPNRRTTK